MLGAVSDSEEPKRRQPDPGLVGTTLMGRYHLVRMLGDGGMGAVYKAADQVLRRFVAIKLLHPQTAENPSAVERFVREARSAAAIGHPNIIDILDFGYEKGRPFLVMEYLRGRALSELIAEERRLSIERSVNIATHSLAGLAAAHDRGILHRDLKPANLMLIAMLGDNDFVKVCDFGFAALVQPSLPQTVDVWILDSSPTDTTGVEPVRGSGSEHGYAVGLAIRDTVCPQGRGGVCPVRFRHRQVLDLDGQSNGVGYIGDLADGVMKAVDGGARVIVLAVGFHEDYALFGDDETPGLHVAANALSVALNYAANRGATVVSAAGNAQFGPDVASYYGPNGLYPGEMTRWQAYSMDVGGPSFDFAMTYSASALDGFDEAAPNARLEGEASLAAPGFAQVFEDPFRGGYVLGGTGSSFAAAHLAAVVTLVRAYRPSASVRDVMQTVASTAVSLGRPAHLGAYGLSGGEVRRISACRALASAVRSACGIRRSCPVPTCDTLPAFAGAPTPELDEQALRAPTSEDAEPTYFELADYTCDGEEHRIDGDGVPASFCPAQSFANGIAAPETVGSQPGVDPCGSCSVVVAPDASWLYVALDPAVASSLTSPVLRLGTKSYALPSTLVATALYKIVRVKLPATTTPPTSASLSFLSSASSTQSVTSHVPVYLQN